MPAPSLRELQRAFWRSVTRPDTAAGDPLLDVIAPSATLTPAERVEIYAGMYFHRILDALREDFERVAALLGDERFEQAVRAYLARHSSQHPSIRHVGRAFADFLAEHVTPPCLADLARLEWARLAVFDAPDPAPLRLDDLLAVPVDDWPDLRLAPIAALEVLVSDWPVHRLWEDAAAATCAPARTALRVWRHGFLVYHAVMDRAEEAALGQVRAGDTFGTLCEGFEDAGAPAALLLRWIEDGIVAAG